MIKVLMSMEVVPVHTPVFVRGAAFASVFASAFGASRLGEVVVLTLLVLLADGDAASFDPKQPIFTLR
jgi:hypothetical protein